ncbi:MAG: HEAT repeat domain-containing protein, partial [Marinoscillum sp.]
STQEFRNSLVEYASNYIHSDQHSDDYHRALKVLGYLKEKRAIETIKIRTQDNIPFYYETLYLLAIGSSDALDAYSLLIEKYIEAKSAGFEREQDEKWMEGITPHANIGSLISQNVEEFIYNLTESEDRKRQIIGRFFALWLGTSERLLELVVKYWDIKGYVTTGPHRFGRRLVSKKWLDLWDELSTVQNKKTLIRIARDIYDTRIEDILIETLKNPELSGFSVQSLAAMGSQRACPAIRKLLDLDYVDNKDWIREMAFRALCDLRDPASIEAIAHLLESKEEFSTFDGTIRLASIGSGEAKKALLELKNQSDEELAKGLLHFGSRECIEKAIDIAKKHSREDAVSWLLKQTTYGIRGSKRVGRHIFRTDVELAPLLDFVLSHDISIEIYKSLCSIFSHIDCSSVRNELKKWYDLRNTADDLFLNSPKDASLSQIAFRELADRGDEYVLSEYLAREIERTRDYQDRSWLLERLSFFNRDKLKDTLRTFIKTESNPQNLKVVIDLIGYVGDSSFIAELNGLIKSDIDIVANAAFEANLRLTDPLSLAERW